ncbi:hypothetical protein [Phenylobacterium sp.]|uniref:hypothetical protein n=1 Tax=Phenylobacterium sp. TaxID=1871053 RepID=UPI002CF093BB|nr:hypothetical protein [Phenylobacterium sp.]HLZ73540.1 hypothetical protein [Phenylobacterium sp.]
MDIHKPKPWHGVREFLKEYLTIVVGVLTALAAEAVVENLHEHRLSAEAREAVRGEIATDLGWMQQRRNEQQPCIDRRLDELSAILDAAREGQPQPVVRWVGRVMNQPVVSRRWAAASQAGRTALFNSEEQASYASIYFVLDGFATRQEEEQQTWPALRALEGAKTLSPQMIWGLSEALQKARMENYLVKRSTDRAFASAKVLGIAPAASPHNAADLAVPPACVPIDTDRAAALALIRNPSGEP